MARKKSTAILPAPRPMFYGGPDPITLNRMEQLVTNLASLQRERFNNLSQIDHRRDFDEECGYPKHDLSIEEYVELILREPVASLVNDFFPLECWKYSPWTYENSDTDSDTEFDLALDELPNMLGIEPSYHIQERGSVINQLLLQADMLCGYGRYGAIIYDFDDGKDWSEPVTPKKGMILKGVHVLPEHLARVSTFESDTISRRHGYPVMYQVTFSDPYTTGWLEVNEPNSSKYIHWSRVTHITDRWHSPSPSKVFAIPRIKPMRDPILDIRKVRGSSAEMYYKGAFPGIHFGTHPQLGPDVDVNKDELLDMYEEYLNGLQRAVWTSGMTADQLAPQVVDPGPQIATQMTSISIKMRTPMRILVGSERGELASGDDRKKHNGNLYSRNHMHTTPSIQVPFYDRLINVGVLPQPKKGYKCEWPELGGLSDTEKADIFVKRTTAYGIFVEKGVEAIIPPRSFMVEYDGLDEERADAILAEQAQALEGQGDIPAPLLGLVGGITAMLDMFDKFANGAISEDTLKELIMLFYKVDEEKALEIIADGLPEPPKGSPRDMPPLPPMKGPKATAGPIKNSEVVVNWLTLQY